MTTIQSAYARFCRKRFPLPSETTVSALENGIAVAFPADYRRFMLEFNGGYFDAPIITPVSPGCPTECLDSMFGIGASHPSSELGGPVEMSLFDGNEPPIIVPIGRTSVGGLIILDVAPGDEKGSICLKQAWGDFYYLASGIEAFFALLREPTRQ